MAATSLAHASVIGVQYHSMDIINNDICAVSAADSIPAWRAFPVTRSQAQNPDARHDPLKHPDKQVHENPKPSNQPSVPIIPAKRPVPTSSQEP